MRSFGIAAMLPVLLRRRFVGRLPTPERRGVARGKRLVDRLVDESVRVLLIRRDAVSGWVVLRLVLGSLTFRRHAALLSPIPLVDLPPVRRPEDRGPREGEPATITAGSP